MRPTGLEPTSPGIPSGKKEATNTPPREQEDIVVGVGEERERRGEKNKAGMNKGEGDKTRKEKAQKKNKNKTKKSHKGPHTKLQRREHKTSHTGH